MWKLFTFDVQTGAILSRLHVPAFSWQLTHDNESFGTRQSEFGELGLSGLELPWTAVPGRTPHEKAESLQAYKRGIVACWAVDDRDEYGVAKVATIIAGRQSRKFDCSIECVSIMDLLDQRYLVHEGRFAMDADHTTRGEYTYRNLSWRALACEVIRECTLAKQGGALPIDLPYVGERGTHSGLLDGADDIDKDSTSQADTKSKKREDFKDGYRETTVEGNTTTVVEQRTAKTTTVKRVTETYMVTTKKGPETRTRVKDKTIPTGKTTVTTTTKTTQYRTYTEVSVTVKTVVTTYDGDGRETGSTTKTDGPHVTRTPKQTDVVFRDFNITNHSCANILRRICSSDDGPDMRFRPYITNGVVRWHFEAGSDGDIHLPQRMIHHLTCSASLGGTLSDVVIDHASPMMRVYATGAGSDIGTTCAYVEKQKYLQIPHPYPLRETTLSMSDAENYTDLAGYATALLDANDEPLMQITGVIHVDETTSMGGPVHRFSSMWPGDLADVHMSGYPDLPDGDYRMRVMSMSGTDSDEVTIKFNPVADPTG